MENAYAILDVVQRVSVINTLQYSEEGRMTYPLNVVPKSSAMMRLSPSGMSRAAVYGGGSMDANTHGLRRLMTLNIYKVTLDRVTLIII